MNLKELMLNNEKCYNILNSKIVLDFSPDGYLSISDYSINDNMLVLKKGFEPSTGLIEYISKKCNERIKNIITGEDLQLKDFEIPASFEFIDIIPRNTADKIDYQKLEEQARLEYETEKNKKIKVIRKDY